MEWETTWMFYPPFLVIYQCTPPMYEPLSTAKYAGIQSGRIRGI